MKALLYISLPFLLADQGTKWLAIEHLKGREPVTVIPGFFDLVFVGNTGAAFGMFKNQNILFVSVSLIALTVMGWMFAKKAFTDNWSRTGGLLLIPGIIGNLIDRLQHGYVVDFLDFHIGGNHWPAFNVADSCICVAVGCFLISSWKDAKKLKTAQGST